jgi:hypothetical protein
VQTVFVDFTDHRRPREIQRDARDPFDSAAALEQLARVLSASGRTVRVYATGPYVPPWRKSKTCLYESRNGTPTEDYR